MDKITGEEILQLQRRIAAEQGVFLDTLAEIQVFNCKEDGPAYDGYLIAVRDGLLVIWDCQAGETFMIPLTEITEIKVVAR